jgi:D-alanyl-D-alanine carboxypeptidase
VDHTAVGNRLQSEIEALVRKSKDIFSAVLGVATKNGDFHWSGSAGTAHADKGDVMKVDTPIFMASITKMYTSAATLILEERGLLSLDDPISEFLPSSLVGGLHRFKGRDYSDLLTIYHLISQTSGLPDYFTARPRGGKSVFDLIVAGSDEEWDLQAVVDMAKNRLSPKFPPEPTGQQKSGKRAHYSDTNYQLLGAIIESVTGKPLHEVFDELIIEPLELASTYLYGHGRPHAPVEGPPANIYYGGKPLYLDKAMRSFGPDGGIVSNVDDSLTFIRSLMEGKLFERPSTLERMKNWKRITFPLQYGLGLMRFKLPRLLSPFSPAAELIGHAGASNSFLFHSDLGQVYMGGTLNQVQNQGRPFRLMLKVVSIVHRKAT